MSIKYAVRLVALIQKPTTTYIELVEFIYGETPPEDNNFLRIDYSPYISRITKYGPDRSDCLFSIIIASHNRSSLLYETLGTIAQQKDVSREEYEIVVVDNGSEDETEKVITNFEKQSGLKMVSIKLRANFGPELARNIGVLYSSGDLLVFTDDDCLVPTDWLSWFKQTLASHPGASGAGGWKEPYSITGKLDIYHRFAFWTYTLFPAPPKNTAYSRLSGYTANFCCRKEIFKKIGGYNIYFKHVGFLDFPVRLYQAGHHLIYEPRMVRHVALFSFRDTFRKYLLLGWDYYLLHLLYPNIWRGTSFFTLPRRIVQEIRAAVLSPKDPPIFKKTVSDIIGFSFLVIMMNFGFWLGKYSVPIGILSKRRDQRCDSSNIP